jgi:hypothetical protein
VAADISTVHSPPQPPDHLGYFEGTLLALTNAVTPTNVIVMIALIASSEPTFWEHAYTLLDAFCVFCDI